VQAGVTWPDRRRHDVAVQIDRRRSDEDLADHLFSGGYRPAADHIHTGYDLPAAATGRPRSDD
jgi:hypothetical protein